MTTIYFVRHATSDRTVKDGTIRPLTPKGLEDAQRLVFQFRDIHIDKIYASPFKRAIDTVLPLAQNRNLSINIVDDFRERKSDFVQTIEKHDLTMMQWNDFTYTLSDGESFHDVQSRNISALKQVVANNRDKSVVIGTHGVALCTMIQYYQPIRQKEFEAILLQMPYVTKMTFEGEAFVEISPPSLSVKEQKSSKECCKMRTAEIKRSTKETDITVALNLDTAPKAEIQTGVGFFDHMLTALAIHSGISLSVTVKGDLEVDCHHTIEDTGIVIGQALAKALSDKGGIARYGTAFIPMDEALGFASLDISGRPFLVYNVEFTFEKMGDMDTQMVEEFFRALSFHAGITLHISAMYGTNDHHKAEAMFKAFAHALKTAIKTTDGAVLSTKGVL